MSISKKACKTEIFIAIEYGDTEQVRRMLDAYPELLNTKNSSQFTPIMFAVRYG